MSKSLRPLPIHIPNTLSILFFPHSSTTCSLSFFHTREVVEEVVVLDYTVYLSVADLGEDLWGLPKLLVKLGTAGPTEDSFEACPDLFLGTGCPPRLLI